MTRSIPSSAGAFIAAMLLLPSAPAFAEPPVEHSYLQATALLRRGAVREALSLLLRIQEEAGAYRDVNVLVSECLEELRSTRASRVQVRRLARARDALSRRDKVRASLCGAAGVTCAEGDAFLFSTPPSSPALERLVEFALTFPRPFLSLTAGDSSGDDPASPRRARELLVPLARRLLDSGAFLPERTSLWTGPVAGALEVRLSQALDAADGRLPLPGGLLRTPSPVFEGGRGKTFSLSVSLLNPAQAAGWTSRLVDAGGRTLRRWEGAPLPTWEIVWDGLDAEGKPAPAGRFEAVLELSLRDGAAWTEKAGFEYRPPSPAAVPPREELHGTRLRFLPGKLLLDGASRPLWMKAVETLLINPGRRLTLAWQADPAEGPGALAADRARSLRDELVLERGISADEVEVRAAAPSEASGADHRGDVVVLLR